MTGLDLILFNLLTATRKIRWLGVAGLLALFSGVLGCAEGKNPDCGNGVCEAGETRELCAADCRTVNCGDGVCTAAENVSVCPVDCYCGNGTCDQGETWGSCPGDCGSGVCGDGFCQPGESAATCSQDCFCGNGTCDEGESPASCSEDCSGPFCGNGVCDSNETPAICPQDCPSGCDNPICDLWPPCGCGDDEKCALDVQWNYICEPAGSVEHGETCTDVTDCVEGATCMNVGDGVGACLQWCLSDEDCQDGAGSICDQEVNGAPAGTPDLCTIHCNPVTKSGCGSGLFCMVYTSGGRSGSQCYGPPGTSTGSCTDDWDCVAGMVCITNDYTCRYYCRRNLGNDDCPAGQQCYRFTDPVVIGSTEYGACVE